MRILNVGHAVFAATLIALGILGLIAGDIVPVWAPLPKNVPGREVLVYLFAIIPLACGIGLFWRSTATAASRLLLVCLVLWLLLVRLPDIFPAPAVLGSWYRLVEALVYVAAAGALYAGLATDRDRRWLHWVTGDQGVRIARLPFGAALIFFGASHFVYVSLTTPLVPAWLPAPSFWAYFFGCTYIAAGVAVIIGVYARLAAALVTLQMGMFTVLVWVPRLAAGQASSITGATWREFVVSWTLTAAAWVIADSCRGAPWFAVTNRRHRLRGRTAPS